VKIFIIRNKSNKTPPVAITDPRISTDGLPNAAPGTLFEVLVTEGVNIEQIKPTEGAKK
jgi:hypothetical protein